LLDIKTSEIATLIIFYK